MTEAAVKTYADYTLPQTVSTKIDLSRLVSEMEKVNNEITEMLVRAKAGAAGAEKPVLSESLTSFLSQNGLGLTTDGERTDIVKQLRKLKDAAPVIHMTFATAADPESLQTLVQWLRISIHPQALISVGLQPGLVAGVYIRTPNHVHDLSLRSKLQSSRDILVKDLGALRG